jgi:hypothetical protein
VSLRSTLICSRVVLILELDRVLAVRSGEVVRGILDEGWFGEEAGQLGGLGSTKAWTLGGFVNEGAGLNTLEE